MADTPQRRMQGLLGTSGIDEGHGLVLKPCSMIHTWFMRYAIDVVFVDRDGRIVRTFEELAPFRLAWGGWRAHMAVELPAGSVRRAGAVGDERLRIEPA
jgi:uncharacterized membrane protein (UPF0127 family)